VSQQITIAEGAPTSTYLGEAKDWDGGADAELSLEVDYNGGSEATVTSLTFETRDYRTSQPMGAYVELTLDEAERLVKELQRVINDYNFNKTWPRE